MFNSLTKRQRQGFALVLLLAGMLVIVRLLILPPIVTYNKQQNTVEDLRFKLAKYQQAVSSQTSLDAELASLENDIDDKQLFQEGVAPGVVAAQLQKTVRQLVESLGANIISTQVLTEKTQQELIKVAVTVRLTVADDLLEALLYQLESSKPTLFIDKLSIATNRRPEAKTLAQMPLNVSLELSTYIHKTGP